MKAANPKDYHPKSDGWPCLNHSRCPTDGRSEVIDPSLESYESPLQEEPTLPSLRQTTMEGASLEMDQTLGSSPSRDFDRSARPLARLGFEGTSVFLEPRYLLFLLIPNWTTFGTWS